MLLHFLQYLRKYSHLSHPNERRNQTKSIARMDLKLRRRKEKIDNERKEEGVRERNRERERKIGRTMIENGEEMIVFNSFFHQNNHTYED